MLSSAVSATSTRKPFIPRSRMGGIRRTSGTGGDDHPVGDDAREKAFGPDPRCQRAEAGPHPRGVGAFRREDRAVGCKFCPAIGAVLGNFRRDRRALGSLLGMFSRLFGVLCTALQFGFALLSRHGASLDCLKVNARGTLKGTRTDA